MALEKKNKPVGLKTGELNEVDKMNPEERKPILLAAAANEKEAKKEAKKPPKG